MNVAKFVSILSITLVAGIIFRLWHIEFGLPQSFPADEPEIVEPAIKYTYEIKNIIQNKDFYKLTPISFVYGTVPTYLNMAVTMAFSKTMSTVNLHFDKLHIYLFLRTFNAILSMLIVAGVGFITNELFKNRYATLFSVLLAALNWKLIVHAHFINADIIQTIFLTLSYAFIIAYSSKNRANTVSVTLSAILFGLALGTKITTAIGLPAFLYIFIVKRDWKSSAAFILISLGTFMATNPFSFIFADDFFFRILEMFTKEAGLVFDSADSRIYKYLLALAHICTPYILVLSIYSLFAKKMHFSKIHNFFLITIFLYLIFFSLQGRLADKWMLPVLPVLLTYAGGTIGFLFSRKKDTHQALVALVLCAYIVYPISLLFEYQKNNPRSEAYYWAVESLDKKAKKLVYTEEGLDPFYKLANAHVELVPVYSNSGAHLFFPADVEKFDYIIVSDQVLNYHQNNKVKAEYPLYFQKWNAFNKNLKTKFELVKVFETDFLKLSEQSTVYIFRKKSIDTMGLQTTGCMV